MRRKHRVMHVITRLELGGAQQNTLFCVTHHDRTRFEVGLVAGSGGLLDAEALAIDDAQVRLLPCLRHAIAPLWDLITIFRLRSFMRARRIDLVHTHSSKAGILGRAAGQSPGHEQKEGQQGLKPGCSSALETTTKSNHQRAFRTVRLVAVPPIVSGSRSLKSGNKSAEVAG